MFLLLFTMMYSSKSFAIYILIDSKDTYIKYKLRNYMEHQQATSFCAETTKLFADITIPTHIKQVDKKSFGIDMNNLLGLALQQIRDLCNAIDKTPTSSKMDLVHQIRTKQEEALKSIRQKIQLVLSKGATLVAVFDGTKTQKIKQIRTYILQQKKENNMTETTAKNFLIGKTVIQEIFYKRKYELQNSQTFWQIYQETLQRIIVQLKALQKHGVQVFVAPYEADSQLIKLFKYKKIDIVVSKDRDYVNHGVPLLLNLATNGSCELIDVSSEELSKNKEIQPYKFIKVARENPVKRSIFSALAGSKHLPKLRNQNKNPIPTPLLVQIIAYSNNLQQVFQKIKQRYVNVKIPNYYKELVELAVIVELASPFYNTKNKRVQCFEQIALQFMQRRLVNIENIQRIWNYEYTKEVKEGLVNVHTGLKRDFVSKFVEKEL